jgi:hypothetical protein
MKEHDIRAMLKKGVLESELEFERAQLADRKLRVLAKDDPAMAELRASLRRMIEHYQQKHWVNEANISLAQVQANDLAEAQVESERKFLAARRALILSRLVALDLKQQDLGLLLGHNKSYTSELLNGVRAFSQADLILVHQLLQIPLKDLLFVGVPLATEAKVRLALTKLATRQVGFKGNGLALVKKSQSRAR